VVDQIVYSFLKLINDSYQVAGRCSATFLFLSQICSQYYDLITESLNRPFSLTFSELLSYFYVIII